MKKNILPILSIILISFLGIVAWMNLTPGYFQRSDYFPCGVDYETYAEHLLRTSLPHPLVACQSDLGPITWLWMMELNLAKLDFNHGPNVSNPIESLPQERPDAKGKFCGGIAGNLPHNQCPSGYKCQLDESGPDASGHCVKSGLFGF